MWLLASAAERDRALPSAGSRSSSRSRFKSPLEQCSALSELALLASLDGNAEMGFDIADTASA